jgi:single-stranded DNA-binding protein
MAIHTQQSLSGFIATVPELTVTSKGDARFYARIGQEHFQRNDDGSFTPLETTFHNLVQYRTAAERSYERFEKGDSFVAEGYVREYDRLVDGQPQRDEEFVAKKIGHDAARHSYTLNRLSRTFEQAPQRGTTRANGAATVTDGAGQQAVPAPRNAGQGTFSHDSREPFGTNSAYRSGTGRPSGSIPF